VLLNLIRDIEVKIADIKEGSIIIYCNNDKVVDMINEGLIKVTEGTQDNKAAIYKIIEIINRLTVTVFLEKIEEYPKSNSRKKESFIDNPGKFLIKWCDLAAKEVRKKAKQNKSQNIHFIADYTLIIGNEIIDRPVSKTIRIINTQACEYQYTKSKFGKEKVKLIDRNYQKLS